MICHEIVEWRNRNKVNEITPYAIDKIIPRAVDAGSLQFDNFWHGLKPDERKVLFTMCTQFGAKNEIPADEIKIVGKSILFKIENFDIALDRLLHIGIIDLSDELVCIKVGLLKYWITRGDITSLIPEFSIDLLTV